MTMDERKGSIQRDSTYQDKSEYDAANYGVASNAGQRQRAKVLGAKSLMSHKVVDAAGEDLGKIDEFMVDVSNGHVSYAVFSHGGVLGIGDKLLAIPWPAFTVDTKNERLVLSASKDLLNSAPSFPKDNWPDMTSDEFCSTTYGYYGCAIPGSGGSTETKPAGA